MSEEKNVNVSKNPGTTNKSSKIENVKDKLDQELKLYVKAAEMKPEDLMKLKQATVTLTKRENRKTDNVNYIVKILLDDGMEFEKYITKNEYLLICMKRKLDQHIKTHSFRCPIRFIKGEYTNLEDFWIRYETFVCGGFHVGDFLTSRDKYCIDLLGENFKYDMHESQEQVLAQLNEEITDEVYSK